MTISLLDHVHPAFIADSTMNVEHIDKSSHIRTLNTKILMHLESLKDIILLNHDNPIVIKFETTGAEFYFGINEYFDVLTFLEKITRFNTTIVTFDFVMSHQTFVIEIRERDIKKEYIALHKIYKDNSADFIKAVLA